MDFITQRFVAFSRRLLEELRLLRTGLAQLVGTIRDREEAERQQQQREQPPEQILRAELQVPEDIRREERTSNNRQFRVQASLAAATWLAFAAAAIYAGITYGMWKTAQQTLTESRATTGAELAKIGDYIIAAQTANTIAIESNRPWLGTISIVDNISTVPDANTGINFTRANITWVIKNAGKRPAQLERIMTTGETYGATCSDNPSYTVPRGVIALPFTQPRSGKQEITSRVLMVPDTTTGSMFSRGLELDDWKLVEAGIRRYCVYLRVEYRDVSYPKILHHTRDCMVYMPQTKIFTECSNGYAGAD